MKKYFAVATLIFILACLCPGNAGAQTVYSVKYKSDAQVKVFVAQYKSDADLVVYKAPYKSDAEGNAGIWFFTDYPSEAKKKIFFVDYRAMQIWSYSSRNTKAMPAGKTGVSSN